MGSVLNFNTYPHSGETFIVDKDVRVVVSRVDTNANSILVAPVWGNFLTPAYKRWHLKNPEARIIITRPDANIAYRSIVCEMPDYIRREFEKVMGRLGRFSSRNTLLREARLFEERLNTSHTLADIFAGITAEAELMRKAVCDELRIAQADYYTREAKRHLP